MRSILIAASLALLPVSTAAAQSCDAGPEIAAHRTANSTIRAQYNALTRGEWPEAIHFGEEAAESGMSPIHKRAAWANLCGAHAAAGNLDAALAACDTAVEMDDDNWRALNNRGVALWLSGQQDAAISAFQAADLASAGESEVAANLALSQCMMNG